VTGFGLLGHLRNILRGSGLAATIELGELPLLPGAASTPPPGSCRRAAKANLEHLTPSLRGREGLGAGGELLLRLACDAKTQRRPPPHGRGRVREWAGRRSARRRACRPPDIASSGGRGRGHRASLHPAA